MSRDPHPGGPWVARLEATVNTSGPGLAALAKLLDVESSPPALRELARAYLRPGQVTHAPARPSDPATSKAAAARVRRPAGPGSKVHLILSNLDARRDAAPLHARQYGSGQDGYTSRELVETAGIAGAWKRTSEMLADGLVEVVKRVEYEVLTQRWVDREEVTRDGSRVLRITDAGMTELVRLDHAAKADRPR